MFVYRVLFFFFKQKTAYEMRISDWSSDVCSSDLAQQQDPVAEIAVDLPGAEPAHAFGMAPDDDDLAGNLPFSDELSQRLLRGQIGRASCRERVCQYV